MNELIKEGQRAEVRNKIYVTLAHVYNQLPGKDFVQKANLNMSELRKSLLSCSEVSGRWQQLLLKKLGKLESALAELERQENLLNLSVERTRLFRGIRLGYGPPPPYESVYQDQNMVMGEDTRQIASIYKEAGYSLPEGCKDPPDYIGIEIDFMAYLCLQQAEAGQKGDRDIVVAKQRQQDEFLDNHILKWLPGFCKKARTMTGSLFLADVLEFTRFFLEIEKADLDLSKMCQNLK